MANSNDTASGQVINGVSPHWWLNVPEDFRDCYAEVRHDLDEVQAGVRAGFELEWYMCARCTTERLTTIDPKGLRTHEYFYPPKYKESRPPMLTEQERLDYFVWRAKRRRKELPKFDLRDLAEKFPRTYGHT